eukprot:Awhi_evm1s7242
MSMTEKEEGVSFRLLVFVYVLVELIFVEAFDKTERGTGDMVGDKGGEIGQISKAVLKRSMSRLCAPLFIW